MRATLSAGMAQTCSPAVSSVINQSERAVESQSSRELPDRFLKPSTATDWRMLADEPTRFEARTRRYRAPARIATKTVARATTIHLPSHTRRCVRGTGDIATSVARDAVIATD